METESPVENRVLVCPLCGGAPFGIYRGREDARCAGCGAKERGRFLGLVLKRLAPPPSGAPVYHFAPEPKIAEILPAATARPTCRRTSTPTPTAGRRCRCAGSISVGRARRSPGRCRAWCIPHVLEHIPAPLERVVRDLNALIEPGGFHLFQVPIHDGWYREDMDPDLPRAERERRFFQHDHMRIFGKRDFGERLLDLFEGFEPVELARHVTPRIWPRARSRSAR